MVYWKAIISQMGKSLHTVLIIVKLFCMETYILVHTYIDICVTILTHFQLAEYVSLESIIQKSALELIVNALSQEEKMKQPSRGVKKGATPTKRSVQNAYRRDNGSIETVAHKTKLPALLHDQAQDRELKALITRPKCSQGHKCLQCEQCEYSWKYSYTHAHTHSISSRGLVVKSERAICTGVEAKVIRDSLKKNYTTFCGAITRCKNALGRGLIVRLGSSCEILDAWQMQWAVDSAVASFGLRLRLRLGLKNCLRRSLWSWFLVIKYVRCNFRPLLCNVQLFCRLCRNFYWKASTVGKGKGIGVGFGSGLLALGSFTGNLVPDSSIVG